MAVLAIELSSVVGSIAVAVDGEVVASREIGGKFEYDEKFVPALNDLFKKAGISKDDIECIGLNVGPGSFTGIRIALAAAKGIAFAKDIPILDFNSLDIMLFQAHRELEDLYVVPVICIKKNSYFAGVYRRNKTGGFKCIKKADTRNEKDLRGFLDKGYTLYGYGMSEELKKCANYPTADALSLLTYQSFINKVSAKKDIEPVYVWDFVPSTKKQYIK